MVARQQLSEAMRIYPSSPQKRGPIRRFNADCISAPPTFFRSFGGYGSLLSRGRRKKGGARDQCVRKRLLHAERSVHADGLELLAPGVGDSRFAAVGQHD